ncbi:serine hydrolase domain-containing protein [Actinophytocola sediminis]
MESVESRLEGADQAVDDGGQETGERLDTTVMQRDADALLAAGAPGVLAELSTATGEARVRSGFGDTDARTPVDWSAKFRIGSYTKTFVAATLLQLVGDGTLALDDTVEKWLPGVVSGNGNDGGKITLRQLLQHTSGIPEYLQDLTNILVQSGFERDRYTTFSPDELVGLAMTHPPDFAPGADWRYSNTNYILAGMVISKATGNDWRDEVRARVIEPLGLKDTTLPGTDRTVPEPHAIAYERFPDVLTEDAKFGPPVDATELNPSFGEAAGEIISTTADGNTFLRSLLSGKLLGPAELAEMKKTVPAPMVQPAWPGAKYGLGLMFIPNSCGGHWAHGGDIQGFKTRNGASEDGSRSVMISINTDSMMPGGKPATTPLDPTLDLVEHALCGTG